jgi:predicted CoA-binding protein
VTDEQEDLEQFREIYDRVKTIAVVGASNNPTKPAYSIPRYLKGEGFRIIPVNPNEKEVQGDPAPDSVEEIEEPVEAVDVFRPAEETPDIARSAAKIGATVLWLQEGIHSDEAEQIARDEGMTFVSNRCMGETHWMLFHHEDG